LSLDRSRMQDPRPMTHVEIPAGAPYTSGHSLEICLKNCHFLPHLATPGVACRWQSSICKSIHAKRIGPGICSPWPTKIPRGMRRPQNCRDFTCPLYTVSTWSPLPTGRGASPRHWPASRGRTRLERGESRTSGSRSTGTPGADVRNVHAVTPQSTFLNHACSGGIAFTYSHPPSKSFGDSSRFAAGGLAARIEDPPLGDSSATRDSSAVPTVYPTRPNSDLGPHPLPEEGRRDADMQGSASGGIAESENPSRATPGHFLPVPTSSRGTRTTARTPRGWRSCSTSGRRRRNSCRPALEGHRSRRNGLATRRGGENDAGPAEQLKFRHQRHHVVERLRANVVSPLAQRLG
jgi:hypothetical protein